MRRRLTDNRIFERVREDAKVYAAMDDLILALMNDRADVTGEHLMDVIRYRIEAARSLPLVLEEDFVEEAV